MYGIPKLYVTLELRVEGLECRVEWTIRGRRFTKELHQC